MFPEVDPILGPEMRSTGEVLGLANSYGAAIFKAEEATQTKLPTSGRVLISVSDRDKKDVVALARKYYDAGFEICLLYTSIMNVNEIIMNKRIERGVSRKELAEGLGVSESTIYRIETNPNLNPNNKLVKRIYDILRMNVTIIVDDAPIYDEHAHEIDFESYSPTSKSIIFKTIAKEEKMKKLKEK